GRVGLGRCDGRRQRPGGYGSRHHRCEDAHACLLPLGAATRRTGRTACTLHHVTRACHRRPDQPRGRAEPTMAEAGVPNIVVRDRPRATVCRSSGTGARGVVCPVYPLTGCVEDLDIYRYAVAYAVAHDAEILELLRAPVEMRDFGDGIAQMNAGMKSADAQAAFFVAHERAAYFGAQLAW